MRVPSPPARGALLSSLVITACFGEAPQLDDDDDASSESSASSSSTGDPPPSSTAETSSGVVSSDATSTAGSESTASSESTAGTASSESGEPPFCDAFDPVISCLDFEGALEPWMLVRTMEGIAEIALADDAPSGRRVLSTSFPATEGVAPEAYAVLAVSDVLLSSRLRFRIDLPPCAGEITFASITFADDDVTAALLRAPSGELMLSIDDNAGLAYHPLDPDVVAGVAPWSHWELRVDVASAYVDVLVDGEHAAQITNITAPPVPAGPPTVRIGIARKTTGFACTARFDDVVVD